MAWFNKPKTDYIGEMREYLKVCMLQYIEDNPLAADDVIPIFSDVEVMIRHSSEKEITKFMRQNCLNIEHAVLNMIQNRAMVQIKPVSHVELVKRIVKRNSEDHACDLYNYINEVKFAKKLISEKQFEENKLLAVNLSLSSPFDK